MNELTIQQWGCDTETYNSPSDGLKSIQLHDGNKGVYLTVDDWTLPDLQIRRNICYLFYEWLEARTCKTTVYFYNLTFDFSQIAYFFCTEFYEPVDDSRYLRKGQINVTETPAHTYKVTVRTRNNRLISFLDCMNFCGGVSLDNAAKSWIGEGKVDIPTKNFRKEPASPLEREYAMKDAEVTLKLGRALNEHGLMKGNSVLTIGSRTVKDFELWLSRDGLTFDEWAYCTPVQTEIAQQREMNEVYVRPTVKGGRVQQINPGMYKDCTHIDKNSMYPTMMVRNRIPAGPLLLEKPSYPHTYIIYPIGRFYLKDDKIPMVSFQRKIECDMYYLDERFEAGEYPSSFILDGSTGFWEDEFEELRKLYDIEFSYPPEYVYFGMMDNRHLAHYMKWLYKGKSTTEGSVKLSYKLRLNSLYGKFIQRPDGESVSYVGGRHKVQESDRSTYYVPLGSWITSQARVNLNQAICSIDRSDVLYCDTDSIIFKGDRLPQVEIGSQLGQWKVEHEDVDVNIVGPKAYQEKERDGRVTTTCAGITSAFRQQIPFGDLREGLYWKTLKAQRDQTYWFQSIHEMPYVIDTRPTIFPRS